MEPIRQLSRRTWLARVVPGTVAVWTEVALGRGRRGWSVALGGEPLALGLAEAAALGPVEALRVNMGFVTATCSCRRSGEHREWLEVAAE